MNINKLLVTGSIVVTGALCAGACAGTTTDATKDATGSHSQTQPVLKPVTEPLRPITPPTTAPKAPALTAVALKKFDYASEIPPAISVQNLLQPTFTGALSVRAQQDSLAGYSVRALCGRTGVGTAAGGFLRQYLTAQQDLSVTYAVQGFAGDGAQQVMAQMKDAVDNCTLFQDNGSVWVRQPSMGNAADLKGLGDDALVLTTEDGSTHVMIADAFVRRGQFVYQIRVVSDANTPFSIMPTTMWDFVHRAFAGFGHPSSTD